MDKRVQAGKFLQQKRLELGFNKDQISKAAGVSPSTIAAIENGGGACKPTPDTIAKLARGYQLELDVVSKVFHVDPREALEEVFLDSALLTVAENEQDLKRKALLQEAIKEGIGLNGKRYIAALLEDILDQPVTKPVPPLESSDEKNEPIRINIIKDPTLFGQFMFKYRDAANMTQRDAASSIGISTTEYHFLEKGKIDMPSDEIIRKLAAWLNAKYEDVVQVYLDQEVLCSVS